MATETGWAALFREAFRRSKNAVVLVDDQRRHVEVNGGYLALLGYRRPELLGRPLWEVAADGPIMSVREWRTLLRQRHSMGTAEVVRADGRRVQVEFAGHPEIVTGRQLVLVVILRTGRATGRPSELPTV
jgi:PAS domain S-box-containing protein